MTIHLTRKGKGITFLGIPGNIMSVIWEKCVRRKLEDMQYGFRKEAQFLICVIKHDIKKYKKIYIYMYACD